MAKQNDTKPAAQADVTGDTRDEALHGLEEANASLAARVGELEQELTGARAAGTSAAWAASVSISDLEARVREMDAKLASVTAERDEFKTARDEALAALHDVGDERARLKAEVRQLREGLDRGDARRVSPDDELRRTRRALEINALVKLHVEGTALGLKDERAVSAALRLGHELCDEVDAGR